MPVEWGGDAWLAAGDQQCMPTSSEISVTETITETEIIDPTLTETGTETIVILTRSSAIAGRPCDAKSYQG